ncbi:hypothetical protein [Rhodopirellula sp. P2]|uniref:hypothetical protein n=1 Tax=Rhodopirellula sp. P2 TaxID=2127060 RepID=UPI002367DE84|nr:hypothetical protein [Rhodopirellula sp. P2]WDQ19577.1 hypothetical protein PSR62_06580 [Rhodopirellula sp. P2]
MQLVNQLRGAPTTDENSKEADAKLAELRSELEQEFKRMHEQQGSEIVVIEKRLQSLKEIHQLRAENQDKIIQRRIDQLLGRSDPLDWNDTPPSTPHDGPVSPYPLSGPIPAFSNQDGNRYYERH